MAHIINIQSPDGNTHACELKDGTQYLGSSLDCDIVLLDQDIPERHIAIVVAGSNVKVRVLGNLNVEFTPKWGKSKKNTLSEGEAVWEASFSINFSGYIISLFETDKTFEPTPSLSVRLLRRVAAKRKYTIYIGLLAPILILFTLYYFMWRTPNFSEPSAQPRDVAQVEMAEPRTPPPQIVWTKDRVAEFLEKSNIKYKNLSHTNDNQWNATIFALDQADAAYKIELIEKSSAPIRPMLFIKNQVRRAIDITVRSLNINADMIELDDDVAWINGITPGSAQAERVRDILRRDVTGLRDVYFGRKDGKDNISNNNSSGIKHNISGVFPGRFPYIVLDDKKIYRPGDKLDEEATLIAIKEKSYIVRIGGKDLELYLP